MENHHRILHIRIRLGSNSSFWIFWKKFVTKKIISLKNRKNEYHHWVLHTRIRLSTKFQLKLSILVQVNCIPCWKIKFTIEFCRFELVPNFSLSSQFWLLGPNFHQKWNSRSKTKKREHHHWIVLNKVSLSTKFQLKLEVLVFWTKLASP